MSNMSYCRFHNTSLDLKDCVAELEDMESIPGDLDENEIAGLQRIRSLAREIQDMEKEGWFADLPIPPDCI